MAIESSRIYPTIKWVDLSIAFLYVYQRVRFTTYHKKKNNFTITNESLHMAQYWEGTSKKLESNQQKWDSIKQEMF